MRYLHQREQEPLFVDRFVEWFLDEQMVSTANRIDRLPTSPASDPEVEFTRIAYTYIALRERYFDELIDSSIQQGHKQLVLLGAGYDTRCLRLDSLSKGDVAVVEMDTQETIAKKREVYLRRLGRIPDHLRLVSIDLSESGVRDAILECVSAEPKSLCIWQGVSYYLPTSAVTAILKTLASNPSSRTVLGFDCCTPLMLRPNVEIPGIHFHLERLKEIGEPYQFGMFGSQMVSFLRGIGFSVRQILSQCELERVYLGTNTLPDRMWYVISADAKEPSARQHPS